jgi:2,3-diketo-5-methylthio-1-phosphopentane phosphatase
VTFSLSEHGVRGVVLDIEGTTTPIAFVHDVLFPYARAQLREFLSANIATGELDEAVQLLESERTSDHVDGDLATYVEWLMDRDRKSPGLKMLQGKTWERGYGDGTLRGDVFSDVPVALERWRAAEIELAIYSSGSALAQRLLFGSTTSGDLTRHFVHFFDTAIGPKRSRESYQHIARAMKHAPDKLLFVSDVPEELGAARAAGLQTLLCIRPGNAPQADHDGQAIRSFDEIVV